MRLAVPKTGLWKQWASGLGKPLFLINSLQPVFGFSYVCTTKDLLWFKYHNLDLSFCSVLVCWTVFVTCQLILINRLVKHLRSELKSWTVRRPIPGWFLFICCYFHGVRVHQNSLIDVFLVLGFLYSVCACLGLGMSMWAYCRRRKMFLLFFQSLL